MLVVGHFEDLGVSATVTPFDRGDLGPWLSEQRKDEYDVMVWSKVDRAFRSSKDCADVAYWAEQNRKCLVFTDDGIVLDYRESADSFGGMMAKFFLTIASLFGEMELRRFRERARVAHGELGTRDRWATGAAPIGYTIVDHPSGKGKTLATDSEGRAILRDMASRLLAGDSFVAIANYLNETGTRNRGRRMQAKGKKRARVGSRKRQGCPDFSADSGCQTLERQAGTRFRWSIRPARRTDFRP